MTRLFRSLIFVPGNNSRFLEKAKSIQADIVCFDLEDSVPESEKENAKNLIKEALANRHQYYASIYVRTNSPASGKIPKDLDSIIRKGINGVVIPKVNNVKELKKIEKNLASLEKKRKLKGIELLPSIESSEGVVNTYEIVSSSARVTAVVFGVFDFLNDMGIEYTKQPEGAKYARAKIALDARAAGVASIDAIWQDLTDIDGLKQDCIIGKNLGYMGKSIIHPDQIPITHEIFFPTKPEIEWAKKVINAYNSAKKNKKGATTVEGKMIDEVHYKRALSLLNLTKK